MQESLDDNDNLMYLTFTKGKSVIYERFITTFKSKTNNRKTANDSKLCLSYLNKLVDQYNNTYHHSIGKKRINGDYSVLTEKIQTNPKAPESKVGDKVRITKYSNNFSEGYTENQSREIFANDCVLKLNPWTYKINSLNGEKIIGNFLKKNCC